MPSATTVFVAPATRGTGDGSSAANAHALASTADLTWFTGILSTWNTELVASSSDVGINEATTFRTSKPGFEPTYGDKSYVTDVRTAVYVRRVCFLSDVGNYTATGTSPWYAFPAAICPPPADPLTAGTAGQPAIRLVHFVGYRTSDSKMAHEVSTTTTTRTQAIATKSGTTASWANAANYTLKGTGVNAMNNWNGGSTTPNYTWSVTDPSPIRAVFVGSRTPDPRTTTQINNKVQWQVGTNPIDVYDPDGTGVEPQMLNGGAGIVLNPGQYIDPATKAITTVTTTYNLGNYCFGLANGASSAVFQGMEFRDVLAAFTYGASGSTQTNFHAFRDIVINNARYGIWRGDYHLDVEFTRWSLTGTSQKHFNCGQFCQRWSLQDIKALGNWTVGDQYPTLIGASDGNTGTENSYGSGCFRWERVIVENLWTGTPVGGTGYVNGDGIDMEIQGVAIRDYYADLTPDGSVDNKTRPYWVNWNSIIIFNGFFRRNKRCFRSWAPSGYPERVAPHVMRNVTVAGARQYGVFMRCAPPHHKYINWYNADGRCNFMEYAGENYVRVSNDGNTAGDQDCVIHQCYDAGLSSATVSTFLNSNTALGGLPGPWRNRLWTPVTVPSTITVAVNGTVQDNGAPLSVTVGDVITLHPSGMPSGTVFTYTVNGPSSITRSGDDANVTVTL